MKVKRTQEFIVWFNRQPNKSKTHIDTRLENIQSYGYFGDHKTLGDNLLELRWKNGRRVYYSLVYDQEGELVLILLGGFKHEQKKDIAKARKALAKYLCNDI